MNLNNDLSIGGVGLLRHLFKTAAGKSVIVVLHR